MHKHEIETPLPTVTLVLGGVERTLTFDFNAICDLQKLCGFDPLKVVLGQIDAYELRGLLWATLRPTSPTLTLEEVGNLIASVKSIVAIHKAILTVFFGTGEEPETPQADG